MVIDTRVSDFRLVRTTDGLELDLEPLQGLWSEEQYLRLTDQTNRLIEFTDGVIEVLPMPTDKHQAISRLLFFALFAFVQPLGGTVFYAPLRMQVRPGKFREPDLLVLRDANDARRQNEFWLGADMVVEIVSPDRPSRDTRDKLLDYAEAGILEYWIVNPLDDTVTILSLDGGAYTEAGVFRRGERAASPLLPGFSVSVNELLDAA